MNSNIVMSENIFSFVATNIRYDVVINKCFSAKVADISSQVTAKEAVAAKEADISSQVAAKEANVSSKEATIYFKWWRWYGR